MKKYLVFFIVISLFAADINAKIRKRKKSKVSTTKTTVKQIDPASLKKAIAPVELETGVLFTYYAPKAETVTIAGNFNNWNAESNPLTKNKNGVWYIILPLGKGKIQYKFVVNGSDWKPDPNNKKTADDGYGGVNSVFVVSKQYGTKILKDGSVLFVYFNPQAESVSVAGSFNNWNVNANPMEKSKSGLWTLKLKLSPGTYQYKFVVNGKDWVPDPSNPQTADDGYGGVNSVIEVK